MTQPIRVFLDTSVLFSAIWSSKGGARMILKLGEADVVQIVVSPQVLAEIEAVIRRKAPDRLVYLAMILDRCRVEVVQKTPGEFIEKSREFMSFPGDVRVLADAWAANVHYLVSLDKHFLKNARLREAIPFGVGTPGDFLTLLRNRLIISD